MALDFYNISDKGFKSVLFSLNDLEFETLYPVLSQLKKLTGTVIDQYGKTRLHYDHVQLIVQLIDTHRALSNLDDKLNKRLLAIKEKFSSIDADLVAIGD
jgi:hypothetical protein